MSDMNVRRQPSVPFQERVAELHAELRAEADSTTTTAADRNTPALVSPSPPRPLSPSTTASTSGQAQGPATLTQLRALQAELNAISPTRGQIAGAIGAGIGLFILSAIVTTLGTLVGGVGGAFCAGIGAIFGAPILGGMAAMKAGEFSVGVIKDILSTEEAKEEAIQAFCKKNGLDLQQVITDLGAVLLVQKPEMPGQLDSNIAQLEARITTIKSHIGTIRREGGSIEERQEEELENLENLLDKANEIKTLLATGPQSFEELRKLQKAAEGFPSFIDEMKTRGNDLLKALREQATPAPHRRPRGDSGDGGGGGAAAGVAIAMLSLLA